MLKYDQMWLTIYVMLHLRGATIGGLILGIYIMVYYKMIYDVIMIFGGYLYILICSLHFIIDSHFLHNMLYFNYQL